MTTLKELKADIDYLEQRREQVYIDWETAYREKEEKLRLITRDIAITTRKMEELIL